MKNNLWLTFFALLFLNQAKSQSAFGLQAGPTYDFCEKLLPSVGAHLTTTLGDLVFHVGGNIHFPTKFISPGLLEPIDPNQNEPALTNVTSKVNIVDLFVTYRYYLLDNNLEDGGLYGMTGLALALSITRNKTDKFDTNKYFLSNFLYPPRSIYPEPYLVGGIGYDFLLENHHILGVCATFNAVIPIFEDFPSVWEKYVIRHYFGLNFSYSLPVDF